MEQKESQIREHQEAAPRSNRRLPLTASEDLGCPLPPGRMTRSFGSPGNRELPRSEHTRIGTDCFAYNGKIDHAAKHAGS